jgi:hypothetical protein
VIEEFPEGLETSCGSPDRDDRRDRRTTLFRKFPERA